MSVTISGSNNIIKQVISATKTDTFSTTATINSPSPVTGLSVTITPSSASNKILITGHLGMGYTSGGTQCYALLARNGTIIGGGAASGSRAGGVIARAYVPDNGSMITTAFEFLDSPATTSAVVYQIYLGTEGASTVYLGQCAADPNSLQGSHPSSSITVQEVSYV